MTDQRITPMTPEAAQEWIDYLLRSDITPAQRELYYGESKNLVLETPKCCLGHLAYMHGFEDHMTGSGENFHCGPYLGNKTYETPEGDMISLAAHFGIDYDQLHDLASFNDLHGEFPIHDIHAIFISKTHRYSPPK